MNRLLSYLEGGMVEFDGGFDMGFWFEKLDGFYLVK